MKGTHKIIGCCILAGILNAGCGFFMPPVYRAVSIVETRSVSAYDEVFATIEELGAAEAELGKVRVQHVKDTRLIQIRFTSKSPTDAADACNRIATAFVRVSEGNAQVVEKAKPPAHPLR